MNRSDNLMVLLAGGDGSRMKQKSRVIPKPLLPVFDESLLRRHVLHAIDAGIREIVISTKPEWKGLFLEHLSVAQLDKKVKVYSNPQHKNGSLPALLYILEHTKSKMIVMSLADIFSFDNPYTSFVNLQNNYCFFGMSDHFDKVQLSHGGVIFTKDGMVRAIKEKPDLDNHNGYLWNGVSYFPSKLKTELELYLKKHPMNSPEGDFFEFWRRKGGNIKYKKCSDFINVNKLEDLLIASVYRLAETKSDTSVLRIADELRTNLLLKNKHDRE